MVEDKIFAFIRLFSLSIFCSDFSRNSLQDTWMVTAFLRIPVDASLIRCLRVSHHQLRTPSTIMQVRQIELNPGTIIFYNLLM